MITGVILTKNEENNIVDCIESLSFCDEVVVLDDNSSDNTVHLAKMHGVKTIKEGLENDFSKQRNYALTLVKQGWVLFLDADERIPEELAQEIKKKTKTESNVNGYFIKRKDKQFGKLLEYGDVRNKYFLRLGRIDSGKWEGKVHEEWRVEGNTERLVGFIIHEPHKTVKEFLSEINLYTTLRAEELYKKQVKSSFFSILLYTKLKFLHVYFFKLGFLDGLPGLLLSIMMSYHSFLVRAKLYLLQKAHEKKSV